MKKLINKILSKSGFIITKAFDKSNSVPMDSRRIHQILFYNQIIRKIKHLDGSIVECGVGFGRSSLIIAEIIQIYRKNINFYLFDTFEGFPKLDDQDKEIKNINKGYYYAPLDKVKKFFFNSKLSSNINLIFKKGDIKNTLDNFNSKISLLHLDLDIYSSYDFALKKLLKNVEKDGIIIIDEYNSSKWFNIKECVDNHLNHNDYEKINSEFILFDRVYFIKK